jgi:hypothetical protein
MNMRRKSMGGWALGGLGVLGVVLFFGTYVWDAMRRQPANPTAPQEQAGHGVTGGILVKGEEGSGVVGGTVPPSDGAVPLKSTTIPNPDNS